MTAEDGRRAPSSLAGARALVGRAGWAIAAALATTPGEMAWALGAPSAPGGSQAALVDLWLATSLALIVLYVRRRRRAVR